MSKPAVSILMPVRNEEACLEAALASLYRQTLTDWELVATSLILAEAARRDSRVRVLTPAGEGLVSALNTGLAACRADLVARMDGDDISHPSRLERQHERLGLQPETGLLACSFRHFPRPAVREGMLAYEKWQNRLVSHEEIQQDLFVESPFVHPSVMFRRAEVERVGGYRDMGWAEDYDLWLRLAAAGTRFARLSDTLLFWRERPGRATRTMGAYSAEAFRACKAHHLQRGFLAGHDEVILAGAGLEGRAWRRTLAAIGIRVGLWVDVDPRKTGRILHGAPVCSAAEVRADGRPLLITVGTRGAREGVRRWASGAGFVEGSDFVCVT
jgi:glycosyltransferase involved in cell wall biosynthesis